MRGMGLGQVLFALSFAAIGAFSIGFHGFAPVWQLLPKWLMGNRALVVVASVIFLAASLALLVPLTARAASLALTAVLALRLLLLHVAHVVAHPLVEVVYESMSENLIYIAGAWTIYSMQLRQGSVGVRFGNVRAGQILFALALPAIGLSHFFHLNMTAPLIPSYLPFPVTLAYFTGAAWIAAAVGILFGVLPNIAATLTAIMASLFTLLIWVPAVIRAPTNISDWSELCASTAITGAAWAVAESFLSYRAKAA